MVLNKINFYRERFHNITRPHLEDTNIQGLQPDTSYVFQVLAFNQHGPGKLSDELLVHTLPDGKLSIFLMISNIVLN